MRRLFRWLFNIFAALSLLLCVATAVMWIRSWVVADQWIFYDEHGKWAMAGEFHPEATHVCEIISERGRVEYWRALVLTMNTHPRPAGHYVRPPVDRDQEYFTNYSQPFPGIRMQKTGALAYWWILLSYWLPFVLTAILPAAWLLTRIGRTKRRWKKLGLCLHCGYDLRAHKPGDKCPECGTLIVAQLGIPVLSGFSKEINYEEAKRAKNE